MPGPAQAMEKPLSLKKALTCCGLILGMDIAVIGAPMFGVYAGLALVLWLIPRIFIVRNLPDLRRHRSRVALITAAMLAVDIASYLAGEIVAERRVTEVADALAHYKAKNNAYPLRLDDLVPAFLPAIRQAKPFSLMAGRPTYLYQPEAPGLMYVSIPPFGRRVLNVATREWTDVD